MRECFLGGAGGVGGGGGLLIRGKRDSGAGWVGVCFEGDFSTQVAGGRVEGERVDGMGWDGRSEG